MTIIDFIGIVIVLLFMIGGYGRGFIRGFASTVQYILGFIIAKILSPVVAKGVYTGFIEETLTQRVYTAVDTTIKNTAGESLEVVRDSIIKTIETSVVFGKTLAEKLTTNWGMYNTIKEGGENVSRTLTEGVMEQLEPLLLYILGLLAFVVLFILTRFILAIILGVLTTILNSLNLTRVMDSVLGLVLGCMKGMIAAIVVVTILYVAVNYTGNIGTYITKEAFEGSKLFSLARGFTNI